ncbi:hypothetical protein Tco_1018614 [Tanacetum coccineum]|uniref:Uncharacterized protein n=1 Tax=Tanacetum coccineum TaxID=301880 RepID=A0ABQ5FV59_9ASTR
MGTPTGHRANNHRRWVIPWLRENDRVQQGLTLALLEDSEDELKDKSDEEMFEAGEEMDEEFLQSANEKTHLYHSTKKPSTEEEEQPTEQPIPEPSKDESPFLHITLKLSPEAPKKSKKQNRRRVKSQPEPSLEAPKDAKLSPLHSDFESSVGSLDFKMFENNVPTTAKVLAKNLQDFSSFLYAQLFEEN